MSLFIFYYLQTGTPFCKRSRNRERAGVEYRRENSMLEGATWSFLLTTSA